MVEYDIHLDDRFGQLREFDVDARQAITIPRGVMHGPIAHGRTVVLMVERAGVVPTGD